MRLGAGSITVLSEAELGSIQRAALHILREVGMRIENQAILRRLEAYGGQVDDAQQRVRYPPALVERFLAESEPYDWSQVRAHVSTSSRVFHGLYLDPETDEALPWTEERLQSYLALARALPDVDCAGMLGSRLHAASPLEPLWERLYCWKYGLVGGTTIHLDELCPYIYYLCQLRAQQVQRPLAEVFRGVAYLVPPLKLGRHEAYQFVYFAERGLQVHLSDQFALGATAPVTLAGALALTLAEQLAVGILQRAFFGGRGFGLQSSLSPLDVRTMAYRYGRPEMAIANLAMAQIARHYGLPFRGHAGLTDAKLPSVEAGAQKALTAIPSLLAGGQVAMNCGLLATDEVCSPVQMILDGEFAGALRYLCQEFEVTEETLALELIESIGPGGHFVATEHTARHCRREQWQPSVWSRDMLAHWLDSGRAMDVDRARAIYHDLRPGLRLESQFGPGEEEQLLALIHRAARHLAP